MTISDPVGDMFARIRNAQQRNHSNVLIPASKFKKFVLDAMERDCLLYTSPSPRD